MPTGLAIVVGYGMDWEVWGRRRRIFVLRWMALRRLHLLLDRRRRADRRPVQVAGIGRARPEHFTALGAFAFEPFHNCRASTAFPPAMRPRSAGCSRRSHFSSRACACHASCLRSGSAAPASSSAPTIRATSLPASPGAPGSPISVPCSSPATAMTFHLRREGMARPPPGLPLPAVPAPGAGSAGRGSEGPAQVDYFQKHSMTSRETERDMHRAGMDRNDVIPAAACAAYAAARSRSSAFTAKTTTKTV